MPPTRSPFRQLAAGLTCAVAVLAVGLTALASPAAAEAPAPDQGTARFEVDFLMDMIDHHAMAVQMADMCIDKAVHEDLRSMCEDIKASQSAQIDQMQGWLQDWYGMTHEPEMTPGQMRQMDKLAALSGAEFEVEFMESMIQHHRMAIREGEMCLDRADHDELKSLCENIIATQSAEIAQMQQWLCEWYDRCREREVTAGGDALMGPGRVDAPAPTRQLAIERRQPADNRRGGRGPLINSDACACWLTHSATTRRAAATTRARRLTSTVIQRPVARPQHHRATSPPTATARRGTRGL